MYTSAKTGMTISLDYHYLKCFEFRNFSFPPCRRRAREKSGVHQYTKKNGQICSVGRSENKSDNGFIPHRSGWGGRELRSAVSLFIAPDSHRTARPRPWTRAYWSFELTIIGRPLAMPCIATGGEKYHGRKLSCLTWLYDAKCYCAAWFKKIFQIMKNVFPTFICDSRSRTSTQAKCLYILSYICNLDKIIQRPSSKLLTWFTRHLNKFWICL